MFLKTLRKGLFWCFLYVLDIGKKGHIFIECQWIRKKGPFLRHFHWKRVIFWYSRSAFLVKKGLFSFVIISERGIFSIWKAIICPPFSMRVAGPGWTVGGTGGMVSCFHTGKRIR